MRYMGSSSEIHPFRYRAVCTNTDEDEEDIEISSIRCGVDTRSMWIHCSHCGQPHWTEERESVHFDERSDTDTDTTTDTESDDGPDDSMMMEVSGGGG